jgi:uncharacterized protein
MYILHRLIDPAATDHSTRPMRRLCGLAIHPSAVVLAAVMMCAPVAGQDSGSPEALREARELSTLLSTGMIEQINRGIMAGILSRLETQLRGKVSDEGMSELKTEVEKLVTKFSQDVVQDMPTIYARHFNAQELREMKAFYRTPTGEKSLLVFSKLVTDFEHSVPPRQATLHQGVAELVQQVVRKHGVKN